MTLGRPYAEVIGDPVAHSKSPLIHRYWLEKLDLQGDYRRSRVEPGELGRFLAKRRSDPDWLGCNVTIPHKESILPFLDEIDDDARRIGAVNIVVPRDGRLIGFNSDVDGIGHALRALELADSSVLMVGAGGAARAAVAFLGPSGVRRFTIVVRDPGKAEGLRALAPEAELQILPLEGADLPDEVLDLVINASPLGMANGPTMPATLLDQFKRYAPSAMFFDMVYSPPETDFIAAGRSGGSAIADGLTMLISQAARAFRLFFSRPPPDAEDSLRDLRLQ